MDGTAPEITSIAGLEDTIINAQSVDATYSVYDTMGLKSIKVLVDGKVVDEITDKEKHVTRSMMLFRQ